LRPCIPSYDVLGRKGKKRKGRKGRNQPFFGRRPQETENDKSAVFHWPKGGRKGGGKGKEKRSGSLTILFTRSEQGRRGEGGRIRPTSISTQEEKGEGTLSSEKGKEEKTRRTCLLPPSRGYKESERGREERRIAVPPPLVR